MTAKQDILATLVTVANEVEGQLLVDLLNEHGIAAVVTGGFTSQFRAEAPGTVQVVVKQDDLSMASSLLSEHEKQVASEGMKT